MAHGQAFCQATDARSGALIYIYIASDTWNVNVNCFAMKGMKIDYVCLNLFEVYGMRL